MFDIDKMLDELKAWNADHDSQLNPTKGEKELMELKEAVAKLKADMKEKEEANRKARQIAVDKTNNKVVQDYVAHMSKKKKEFRDNYF